MTFHALRGIHALALQRNDAGGVVLHNRGNGGNGHFAVTGNGWQHAVLEGNAELCLVGADHHFGGILAGLNDFHIQTGFLKVALFLRHIQAGVVGVGRPVEHKGYLCLSGGAVGGAFGVVLGGLVFGSAACRNSNYQCCGEQDG